MDMPDPLADRTFFSVLAQWPREVRPFTIEWPLIETEPEALEAVQQNDHAALVFRHDPDSARWDVSEDIARLWLRQIVDRGDNPLDGPLPEFISRHLTSDDIDKLLPAFLHAAE
jgi:hypothetical protein